jgi:CRP/FNR family cyclic AMP-dependent transcriptional regulator
MTRRTLSTDGDCEGVEKDKDPEMEPGALGKEYDNQEVICRQGGPGRLHVRDQAARALVVQEEGGTEVVAGELAAWDVFGEMSVFDRQPRSATVRAKGNAPILTLDKRSFLRPVHEDPSLAFQILQKMSLRIGGLNDESMRLKRSEQ